MKSIVLDQITDSRNNAIKRICDPSINLTKLDLGQRQELTKGYLDCISGTGFMGKYLYGVNVRTSDDLEKIEPYFATSGNVADFKKPDDNKSLPQFADRFKIREIFFYADFNKESIPTKLEIHTLLFEAGIDKTRNEEEIKQEIAKWLLTGNNFFIVNVKSLLKIKSERVYMWLSSEDFFTGSKSDMQDYWSDEDNPFNKKNGQALSNILAISNDRDFLQKNIVSRRIDLLNFLILLKARHLFEQNLQRLRASEKSAKAAIMSRNMSHNLGSHVMAYLKQHLYSVQDMIKDNILDQILSPDDTLETIQKNVDGWLEKVNEKVKKNGDNIQEIAMPFLVGLGKFISYLQERQDFIATIATDYSPYFSTVNFKDFIYDELNPDLRYERHKDRSGMRPDNILLGNIAKSEGLARVTRPTQAKRGSMSDIILKFRYFDGNPVFDNDGKTILAGREQACKSLEQMRDVEISLPGGVVGRQAFFSIIENIIRNAAKHGKWGNEAGSSKRDLILTFDYYGEVKDFSRANDTDKLISYTQNKTNICRPVYGELDSRSFLKKYYSAAADISDLLVFTVTDNMWFELVPTRESFIRYKDNPTVLDKLFQIASRTNLKGMRAALRQRYIDKDGKMINENKGIKEMRISAAWLRSLEDSLRYNPLVKEEEAKNGDPDSQALFDKHGRWTGQAPVLMARAIAQLGEDKKKVIVRSSIKIDDVSYEFDAIPYNLQLVFCLMKPKKVAIISDRRVFSESFRKQLKDVSWATFSSAEYRNRANKNRSYEFIIVDDINQDEKQGNEDCISNYQKIRCISHSRTYKLSSLSKELQNRISKIIDSEKFDRLNLETIEIAMYKTLAGYTKSDHIRISDEKTFAKYQDKFGPKYSNMISIEDGVNRDENGALCRYIYRKHHETDIEFSSFMTESPVIDIFSNNPNDTNNVSFVEGITGNNSTDRLVRNELLTDRWAYAHLHAMKQKIAIFDERIFSKVYRKDEMDIVNHRGVATPFIPVTKEDLIDVLEKYADVLPVEVNQATSDTELLRNINAFLEKRHYHKQNYILADKIGLADAMKGVYVFNLIKTNGGLDIYGFIGQESDGDKYYSLIAKIGSMSLDSEGMVKVSFTEEGSIYIGKFDRISIHQGLLDKVYETLGFKGNPAKKEEVTNALYEQLSTDRCADMQFFYDEKDKVKGAFLPHLMIHSGRSKPSVSDMPQHQPFIQYAAIEHAVLDCKYSLVELMDYARFEQYED